MQKCTLNYYSKLPLVKVKEFAPKIFDKDDENSEYNVKFRLKLQKQKVAPNDAAKTHQVDYLQKPRG